jgi:hypothetical protein
MQCGSCKNRHLRRMYHLHHQGEIMLVTANNVPSSLILATLTMEAIHSRETSVLTRATRHHIPEDSILEMFLKFKSILRYVKEAITM